ncbi:metallophosphoesterase [Pedobacter sp. LMG 31464]|uniref:Metallophosphoesterase n=1 Tax=Pedobacter planticolens TaxID=2679964 RepID=A0A923E145_9SPHI|nr:metallophosphoesterase [Pedobacter planticolens]MBB2146786.1 metallophosphoesterase [Pedobacter planticolens]
MKRKEFLTSGLFAAGIAMLPSTVSANNDRVKRSFRFAFISDIHVKPGVVPEAGMAKAIQHVQNLKPKVDFIVNGGDSIMDALAATKESAQIQWDLFHKIMEKENSLPVYPCIGNHDIYGWFQKTPDSTDPLYGKNWAVKELKMTDRYYHFQKGKWDFIVLDSTQLNPAGGYVGKIDEEQLVWLKNKLAEIPKDRFIVIVSHIPILSICAGLFFNKTEANGDLMIKRNLMHSDFLAIKALFNQYPNIKTCLSGHVHLQDEVHYLGIKYYCNGAICGNWWSGAYQEFDPAYAVFEFFDDGTCSREMVNYG